ncbi:hypothetical protein PVK06_011885 [Gossypium arboreum]|uniref:Uncharacterized protein n=1 Tax=Gossypium arboreum TaxID=29729 RepID=A0ABR0QAC5_GOSAR|nr:hypothetical protein PVK06_011885 [Gossypium arboreum]
MAWKTQFKDTQAKCTQLKRKFTTLEESESSLKEQLEAQKLCYMAELDDLRQSSEEAFRKYQENTTKNLTKALPESNSNLALHTQLAATPMNLSQVDFNFLKDTPAESLAFNVYHPKRKYWVDFQEK